MPNQKSRKFTLFLAPFMAAIAAFAADVQVDAGTLLRENLGAPRVAYTGLLMVNRWNGPEEHAEELRVYFRPANQYRWEFLSPDGRVKRVVVSDGSREQIRFLKGSAILAGTAIKGRPKRISADDEFTLLQKNYDITYRGEAAVAGRAVWMIELLPRVPGKPSQALCIDQQTGVVLESKRVSQKGARATLSRFVRFEVVAHLDDGLFVMEASTEPQRGGHPRRPPRFMGFEEMERMGGDRTGLPKALPMGYVFESGDVFDIEKEPVRHLRYTDGLTVISIFSTARPVRFPRPKPGAIPWEKDGRHFVLVGEPSPETLQQIVESLK